jgi:hypothetical protein
MLLGSHRFTFPATCCNGTILVGSVSLADTFSRTKFQRDKADWNGEVLVQELLE